MANLTPGEWVVNRGEHAHITNVLYYGLICHLGDTSDGQALFVCVDDGTVVGEGGDEEMIANAYAIAAAPKLLKAIGGFLWLGNNLHNITESPVRFREYYEAALKDAREAVDAAVVRG